MTFKRSSTPQGATSKRSLGRWRFRVVAAVQATYVLMDLEATIDRVEELTSDARRRGAQLVVFPAVFLPGTPIRIDTRTIVRPMRRSWTSST